jgi:hypothetical protein
MKIELEPRLPSNRVRNALSLMLAQLENIRLQYGRLGEDDNKLTTLIATVTSQNAPANPEQERALLEGQVALAADVHYLLISVRSVNLLLWRLQRYLPEEPELKEIRTRYKSVLSEANRFRNNLEHIDEALDRGVTEFGSLSGTLFTFDGETIDIGGALRSKIERMFREVLTACETIAERRLLLSDEKSG